MPRNLDAINRANNLPFGLHQKNYLITNLHHLAGGCAVKITVTPSVGEHINCFQNIQHH